MVYTVVEVLVTLACLRDEIPMLESGLILADPENPDGPIPTVQWCLMIRRGPGEHLREREV